MCMCIHIYIVYIYIVAWTANIDFGESRILAHSESYPQPHSVGFASTLRVWQCGAHDGSQYESQAVCPCSNTTGVGKCPN